MSYEKQLHIILNELTLNAEDCQSYTEDATEITNYLMRRMKETNKDFANCFRGASLTGSYLDDLKIKKPDEFDIHIKLELPEPITLVPHRLGRAQFYMGTKGVTFCGNELRRKEKKFYISRVELQRWLRNILVIIFPKDRLVVPLSNGREYRLEYAKTLRGYALAHTFLAIDTRDRNRQISFDFVPAFEFKSDEWIFNDIFPAHGDSWFAVPSSDMDTFTFMVCAPHLERELLKGKDNLKNSLRLLKAIRDKNRMPRLTSYLIKSVYLGENDKHSAEFWQQPMGELLIYMTERLLQCLRQRRIPFYWGGDINLFDRLRKRQSHYIAILEKILQTLKLHRDKCENNVDLINIFI